MNNSINFQFKILILFVTLLFSRGFPGETVSAPQRIVSLAPHVTEIIFKVGAGNLLVGRTEFCKFPEAAQNVPTVGGYLNIDYEKLVTLKPDLILQFPNDENRRKLESLGYRVLDVPDETVQEILEAVTLVGNALGRSERASTVRKGIEDTLKMVSEIQNTLEWNTGAILVVGRQHGSLSGLYLAGKNTYLSQIWESCGGRNIFDDVSQRYFSVNKEDLLLREINIILEFRPSKSSEQLNVLEEKSVWNELSGLNAVKHHRIYLFTESLFLVPGPRITQIAIRFSDIIKEMNAGLK